MPSRGGESKHDENDVIEEDVHFSEEVLAAAIVYCSSPAFTDPITAFKRKHMYHFAEYSDAALSSGEGKVQGQNQALNPECVEHSLECQEVFEEFQALVESLLEEFCSSSGSSAQEFFRECADVVEGKFVPLFEEHENKWFVELIFSWMEYKSFFSEMVSLAAASGCHRRSHHGGHK